MKLVLKKNLEKNGVLYLEGEEVELTEAEYQYITSAYIEERKAQIAELEALENPTPEVTEHFSNKKVRK
jgi:hypothetical protein